MSARAVRWWLILGPLAVAAVLLAGVVGARARSERAAGDVAAATTTADAFAASPGAALEALRAAGYAHAVYRRSADGVFQRADSAATGGATPGAATPGGDTVASIPHLEAPARLPGGLVERLARLDRGFAATLGGRAVAVAPLEDSTRWEVVGALVVAASPPRPPRFPIWVLLLGAAAFLLSWEGLRVGAVRADGKGAAPLGALLVLGPGAALGAGVALLAPDAAVGVGVVTAAWLVAAAIGVSLLSLERTPLALREAFAGWAFLAPSLVHLLVFSVGPIAFALWLSFHRWNLIEPQRPFVGLANYVELAGDAAFLRSLVNTAIYVLFVPVGMAVALALALLVNRPFRGVKVVRAILFLPYITSFVAISLVWKWMYEPDFGVFNLVLERLGLGGLPWLSSPATAMLSLQIMAVWMYAGYMMILFLAGLQSIPESLYESARMDGAGAWQRFRHITLPLLRPTTFFVLVTMVIFMFQVFTAVYVMTEGGPLHATDVIVYHIYRNAWEYLRMGYASAMAWVLFAVVFLLTLAQWRWIGRERV